MRLTLQETDGTGEPLGQFFQRDALLRERGDVGHPDIGKYFGGTDFLRRRFGASDGLDEDPDRLPADQVGLDRGCAVCVEIGANHWPRRTVVMSTTCR